MLCPVSGICRASLLSLADFSVVFFTAPCLVFGVWLMFVCFVTRIAPPPHYICSGINIIRGAMVSHSKHISGDARRPGEPYFCQFNDLASGRPTLYYTVFSPTARIRTADANVRRTGISSTLALSAYINLDGAQRWSPMGHGGREHCA